jgi:hypothetical protein
MPEEYKLNAINNFGGHGQSSDRTYVEFGDVDKHGHKKPIRTVYDQDAYDLWHLAVRYKECLAIQNLMYRTEEISFDRLPRKEKFFYQYLALFSEPNTTEVLELGCSLMEIIDGMILYDNFFQKYNLGLRRSIKWFGIEISELLRAAAKSIHTETRFTVFESIHEAASASNHNNNQACMHDFGVGSYVFNRTLDYAKYLNSYQTCCVKCFVCDDQTYLVSAGSKTLTVFSLSELRQTLNSSMIFMGLEHTLPSRQYMDSKGEVSRIGHYIIGNEGNILSTVDLFKEVDEVYDWLKSCQIEPVAI